MDIILKEGKNTMFKKNLFIMALAFACSISMVACTEKEIAAPEKVEEPDLSHKENVIIDWEQVRYDLDEIMVSEDYPLVSYIDFAVYEEKQTIRLILPLKNEATHLESLDYGEKYIKMFNDVVATQDFSIEQSSEDYYGGLWDEYILELEVYAEKDIMNPELYFVNQVMDAGANDPVIPQVIEESSSDEESVSGDEGTAVEETASAE